MKTYMYCRYSIYSAYYPGAKPGKKHALNKQYALNSELRLLTVCRSMSQKLGMLGNVTCLLAYQPGAIPISTSCYSGSKIWLLSNIQRIAIL